MMSPHTHTYTCTLYGIAAPAGGSSGISERRQIKAIRRAADSSATILMNENHVGPLHAPPDTRGEDVILIG